MSTEKPVVLLHWDKGGGFQFMAAGDVRIVCVDERSTERVYETGAGTDHQVIQSVVDGTFRDPLDAVNAKERRQ